MFPMIYLASQSPQRAELLRRAGIPFQVVQSAHDEEAITASHPQTLALDRARHKADRAIVPPGADGILLAADTVVFLGRETFGSPTDDADGARILGRLAGTTHAVATGHHAVRLVNGERGVVASSVALAKVTMRPLDTAAIQAYLATGEHRGRAGAYAIQETGDRFVTDLQGTWDTVVGLSLASVARVWRELTDTPLPGSAS